MPKDIKRNLLERIKSIIQVLDTPSSVIGRHTKAFVVSLAIIFITYIFFRGIGTYAPEIITGILRNIGFGEASQSIIDHFKVDPTNPLSLYVRWYFNDALIIPAMLSLYYLLVAGTGYTYQRTDFPETNIQTNRKEEVITSLLMIGCIGLVMIAVAYHFVALWVMVLNPIVSGFLASKLIKRLIPLLKQDAVVTDRRLQFKQSLQHGLIWITLFEIFAHVQNELLELRFSGTFDLIDLSLLVGSAVISYVMIRILITHTSFPWTILNGENLVVQKNTAIQLLDKIILFDGKDVNSNIGRFSATYKALNKEKYSFIIVTRNTSQKKILERKLRKKGLIPDSDDLKVEVLKGPALDDYNAMLEKAETLGDFRVIRGTKIDDAYRNLRNVMTSI